MNKKEKILIQKYIDGDLSASEKEVVENIIRNNTDAEKYYNDLLSIDNLLKQESNESYKIDLKDQIMKEIQKNDSIEEYTVNKESFYNKLFPNLRWRIAYAFVFGIIIGALIVALMPRKDSIKDLDESQLSGSISNNASSNVFTLPVDIPGVKLNITSDKLKENFIKILIDLKTDEPGMLSMSFNKSGFYLQSFRMLKENNECRINNNRNSVQLYNYGENVYVLLMKKMTQLPEDLNIQLFQDQMIKYENTVTIN